MRTCVSSSETSVLGWEALCLPAGWCLLQEISCLVQDSVTFSSHVAKQIFPSSCSRSHELWFVYQKAPKFLQKHWTDSWADPRLSDMNLTDKSVRYLEF